MTLDEVKFFNRWLQGMRGMNIRVTMSPFMGEDRVRVKRACRRGMIKTVGRERGQVVRLNLANIAEADIMYALPFAVIDRPS